MARDSNAMKAWRAAPVLASEREAYFFEGVQQSAKFFMREDDVHQALVKLTRLLDEADIPYAIVGAMALNEYGYRRVTVDIDLLLTRDGLEAFKSRFLGRGYVEKFPGSKGLRDTEYSVPIDVLLTGDYPGDGIPKPIAFPDPTTTAVRGKGVALLPLPRLIELKLASGMTAAHRLRDLADVLELVRVAKLSREMAEELDPSVRSKYLELWDSAQVGEDE